MTGDIRAFTLTPRLNGIPRLDGRGLVLLCSYRGGAKRQDPWIAPYQGRIGRLLNKLSLLELRRFTATYRDHFANPRDGVYQLNLVRALAANYGFDDIDLIVDTPLAERLDKAQLSIVPGTRVATIGDGSELSFGPYRSIVLVYPDPLGLGWDRLERRVLASGAQVVVVTGRRRLFTLDRRVRSMLRWRRILATTRIVELVLAAAIVPVAAVCAVQDKVRGRS